MRIASLHQALGGDELCERIELECDTWTTCRDRCLATGRARSGLAQTDWYQRTYCPRYLDDLVARLDGTRTKVAICSKFNTHLYVMRLAERLEIPVVFDMHNVEAPLWRETVRRTPPEVIVNGGDTAEHMAWFEAAEGAAVEAADEVWVCSETDSALVQRAYGVDGKRVRVVPNVIPVSAGPPVDSTPTHVSFVGRLDYYPNVNAALFLIREVVPALAGAGSSFPLTIAGAEPNIELDKLTLPAGVRLLRDPESVEGLIRGSVVAVPLWEGGGSRFKILEAFNLGAPVVSTEKGVEGLAVEHGVHYLRAETAEEFAAGIRAVSRDHDLRRRLTGQAWELLTARYSVRALRDQLAGATSIQ